MKVILAPDAKRLLMLAGREITRSYKGQRIEDIAYELRIHDVRLDEILRSFTREGFWAPALTIRDGYVTPKGVALAVDVAMRAAA